MKGSIFLQAMMFCECIVDWQGDKFCLFVFLFVCLFDGFNATFNNISVILWWSVLLVEETTDLSQVTDKLYHIMLYTSH